MTAAATPTMRLPGARSTRQRLAVASAMTSSDDFRSARQWHETLLARGHSVGLTTVYRTLQAMADAGDVDVIVTADGENKFRRCSQGHHHHLACRECGRAIEIEAPEVERWARAVAATHSFSSERHTLEITGICPGCAANRASLLEPPE